MKRICILLTSAALALGALPYAAYADDKTQNQMTIDQLPKPARDAIEREAQGGRVSDVAKISDDGRLFKADIKKGDSQERLYVDANGKVLGKHTEK